MGVFTSKISKYVYILFSFCFLIFEVVNSVQAYTWKRSEVFGSNDWQSVTGSSDGSKVYALTWDGYIYSSIDSGVTWTPKINAGFKQWISIDSSSDGTKLIAAANQVAGCCTSEYLYTSTNSGVTWLQRTSAGRRRWSAVASSSDGTKLIASEENSDTVFISTDSGDTWNEHLNIGRGWQSISSSATGQTLIGVKYNGNVIVSTDSGSTWTNKFIDQNRYWRSAAISTDGTKMFAVATSNNIYTSINSGETWTEQVGSGSRNWYGITSSSDGTKLAAVVNGGYIYTSINSGETWTEQTNSGSKSWYAIQSSSDGTKLVALESAGGVYYSQDSGVTWTLATHGALGANWINDIATSGDGSKLLTAISPGYLYTSTDYGVTWTKISSTGEQRWGGLSISSDGTTWIAGAPNNGSSGPIFTSTDGTTWVERTGAGQKNWVAISSSSDGTKLVAANSGGYIYTSINSGVNWVERTGSGSKNWIGTASSSDGTKLAAVVNGGYIYTSINSGANWTEQTGSGSRNWSSIGMSSDGTKLIASEANPASGWGGHVYTSTDSGVTWNEDISLDGGYWYGTAISADGSIVAASSYSAFIYTGTSVSPLAEAAATLNSQGISTNLGSITNQSYACNLYFEKANVAKIEFATCQDLTDPTVITWISSLGTKINLINNVIGLDADLVQGLISTQAVLTMYNVNFSSPKILVNGADDTSGVVSNLVYDSIAKTLTFNAAHFTTFTAVDANATTTSSSSSTSSSTNNSSGSPICNDSKPASVPNLFQINTSGNTAKLFFSPLPDTNTYFISFSTKPSAEEHGTELTLFREGVQSYTVNLLNPNTTYYFKVRGQFGCMPGNWSNILKVTTRGKGVKNQISYYKNSKAKPTPITTSIIKPSTVKNESQPIVSITPSPEIQKISISSSPSPSLVQKKTKTCILWWCF